MLALNCYAQNFVSTTASNKNVLLEGFGGINCYYCAEGDAEATALQNTHPDKIVWINIHAGMFAEPSSNEPDFRNPYSDTLLSFSGLSLFPAAMINRRLLPDFVQNPNKLAIESVNWPSAADTILSEASPVNIAARSEFNISNRTLKVIVESYYTSNSSNSQNRLFTALLLDSVFATQEGARVFNPAAIASNGKYIHRNILFDYINSSTYITNTTSGSFRADTFYYSIPPDFNGTAFDLTSPKVAVWITENDSTNVLNAAYSQMTYTSDFSNSAAILSADWDADFNLLCGTESAAEISLLNLGNNVIDSITVDYSVNSGAVQSISANLSTPLSIGKSQKIQLPSIGGLSSFGNTITLKITTVNNSTNNDTTQIISQLNQAQVMVSDSTNGLLTVRFDNYPEDISWKLIDETDGLTILSDSNYIVTNSIINQNFTAQNGHCYAFIISDSFGDGLCCGSGQGYYELKIGNLRIIRENEFAFESGTKFNFEEGVIAVNPLENIDYDFRLYPNPANDFSNIEIESLKEGDMQILVHSIYGQLLYEKSIFIQEGTNSFSLNTSTHHSGIYLVSIKKGDQIRVLKLSIIK
jgi:hypothetical protein